MPTPNKNLSQPAQGTTPWDSLTNNDFGVIDIALAGTQVLNLTGNVSATVLLTTTYPPVASPLSSASYLPVRLYASGNLTQATTIQIPSGVSGWWIVHNNTNNAFPLYIGNVGGGTTVVCLAGVQTAVYCDGTNAIIIGVPPQQKFQAGDLKLSASPNNADPAGWLICDGRAVSRTTYALLFSIIGGVYGSGDGSTTFNIPDFRGRVPLAADDQGSRGAANVMTSWTSGTVGGAAVITLTIAQLPAHNHTDTGHTHWDSGHSHGFSPGRVFSDSSGGSQGPYGVGSAQMLSASVVADRANIQTSNAVISNTGGGGSHSNVQPSLGVHMLICTGL